MGLVVLLLVLAASGYDGNPPQADPTDDQWFAKAVVNSYDGNRSFSDNFNSLLAILCPNSGHCTKNGTVIEDNNDFTSAGKDHANSSSDFSEYSAIVNRNAGRFHGCCLPCSCDERCTEKGNCCPGVDINSLVPKDGKRVKQECVFAGINSYIPNAHVNRAEATGFSYFMVTDCFSANFSEDIAARCRQPELDEFGPVYSPATKRIYKNEVCAECNGDDHVISWEPVVTFSKDFSLIGKRQIPLNLKDLYELVLQTRRFMNLFYMPPDDMNTDEHTCGLTDEINEWKNPCEGIFEFDNSRFLERACAVGGIRYKALSKTYRNVFCFLCHSTRVPGTSECDSSVRNFVFSFSALLGSTQTISTEVQDVDKDAPCGCREYYNHAKNLCRKLVCPPGEYFALCDCIEFLQNINGMPVKLHLEISPAHHNRKALETFTKLNPKAMKSFEASIKDTISMRWGRLGITYSTLFRETSVADKGILKFHIVLTTIFLETNDSRKLVKNIMTTLQSGIPTRLLASPMTINLGPIYPIDGNLRITALGLAKAINSSDVEIEPVELDDVDNGFVRTKTYKYATTVSKLVYCQRVVLEDSEVAMLRTRPRDLGVSPSYLAYVFREEDGSMCLEDFKLAFLASSATDPLAFGYTGIVMSLLVLC